MWSDQILLLLTHQVLCCNIIIVCNMYNSLCKEKERFKCVCIEYWGSSEINYINKNVKMGNIMFKRSEHNDGRMNGACYVISPTVMLTWEGPAGWTLCGTYTITTTTTIWLGWTVHARIAGCMAHQGLCSQRSPIRMQQRDISRFAWLKLHEWEISTV